MEGGTWLDRWTWSANTPKDIFFISLGLIISNLGPWIAGLFFKKSQEDKAMHIRLGGFIWFIITIAVTQIVVFVIIWLFLVGGDWLFQFFNPPPQVYTHPTQIFPPSEVQPNIQNKTIINRTLNLPSPGVKPGTYNINSNR